MCRALKVLCAAPGREALTSLKYAAVSKEYELTGGATTLEGLLEQIDELEPDAVVIDAALAGGIEAVRAAHPSLRIVALGTSSEAADESVSSADDVRGAVLGLPRPGGPVG